MQIASKKLAIKSYNAAIALTQLRRKESNFRFKCVANLQPLFASIKNRLVSFV